MHLVAERERERERGREKERERKLERDNNKQDIVKMNGVFFCPADDALL